MSPARGRSPQHPVPPEAAEKAIASWTTRLAAAGAVDGADNPLRRLTELLGRWWEETEPRPPAPAPESDRPDTAPADPDPDRARVAPAPEDPSGRRHTALRLLMVLAFAGDVANLYLALSIVGNAEPLVTGLVVVALACSALGLAHLVGRFVRDRAEGRHVPRGVVGSLGTIVLLIGLSAAAVRLTAPLPDSGSSADAFGGSSTSLLGPAAANVLLTILLLVLFLASVVMAAVLGHDARAVGPRTSGSGRPWGEWLRERAERRRGERVARRAAEERTERARAEEEHRILVAHHRHHGEYLSRLSELLLAEKCGDPRTTTVLTHDPNQDVS